MELSDIKIFLEAIHNMVTVLYEALYGLVLHFFKSKNRKIRSKLPVWHMKKETSEHFHLLKKVFKWIVLPASLFYVGADLCFFGKNALDSMLWGMLIFFYSNFLPDLPSIYRRKKNRKKNNTNNEDLVWYKKIALLLFAPMFVWLLFSGIDFRWDTTETFHNFKSLAIYGVFLVVCGLFTFGDFPISVGDVTEILSLPLYGIMGYLTHLKVDRIW